MTWTYSQTTGELRRGGVLFGVGYAGQPPHKNDPAAQALRAKGPIPRGDWKITGVYDSKNTGPFTLILEPGPETQVFGRTAFRIHGDSIANPGFASNGCIILARPIRNRIWESKDYDLKVIV